MDKQLFHRCACTLEVCPASKYSAAFACLPWSSSIGLKLLPSMRSTKGVAPSGGRAQTETSRGRSTTTESEASLPHQMNNSKFCAVCFLLFARHSDQRFLSDGGHDLSRPRKDLRAGEASGSPAHGGHSVKQEPLIRTEGTMKVNGVVQ
mmetsp:Transcript_7248/g.19835  ORF Transcript_7248/g.19835 Transcript_7248/m.19835 type:complete len:149 (+) Transcript_7248:79-525(+)